MVFIVRIESDDVRMPNPAVNGQLPVDLVLNFLPNHLLLWDELEGSQESSFVVSEWNMAYLIINTLLDRPCPIYLRMV